MANVRDVARYILEREGTSMSAMKLQKLCYYSAGWHLVWDEENLVSDRIEAWANGPVFPSLYAVHRRQFMVSTQDVPGDSAELTQSEKDSVDGVLSHYGTKSAVELSDLTHSEPPWQIAREGVPDGARSTNEISLESVAAYLASM